MRNSTNRKTRLLKTAMSKHRTVLNEHQVIEIYKRKIMYEPKLTRNVNRFRSASLIAKEFDISEKTVRDIWKGRTWRNTTRPLESSSLPLLLVKIGRPKGARDKKPRKRREDSVAKRACWQGHCLWCNSNEICHVPAQSSVDAFLESWADQIPNLDRMLMDPFQDDWKLDDWKLSFNAKTTSMQGISFEIPS